MSDAIKRMNKSVWALALELPESVHRDVADRWVAVRSEHAAMLDVIEAAEMTVSSKVMGSAHQEAGRGAGYCDACLRSWPCEGATLSDALARFRDLFGGAE